MVLAVSEWESLPGKKIKQILHDDEEVAKAADLIYVNDMQPGIVRVKRGKGKEFCYKVGNKVIKDEKVLQRIRDLVVPPAWTNVWICQQPNGHLQVTGYDSKNRKQYRYHTRWSSLRNYTKFYSLAAFGRSLPGIRRQIQIDLALLGMPLEKVMATIVCLIERTNIRVGSDLYEKLYGSYGLTTFKGRHVKVSGALIKFSFKGKKGVHHDVSIQNKRLSKIIKKCIDIPGKELFQYYDEHNERRSIDSGMVNEYIKTISKKCYTTKDFRTWSGSLLALTALKEMSPAESASEVKKNIVEALDMVSSNLGNTRAVCKKYYVHPLILELYSEGMLDQYFENAKKTKGSAFLTTMENIFLKILDA